MVSRSQAGVLVLEGIGEYLSRDDAPSVIHILGVRVVTGPKNNGLRPIDFHFGSGLDILCRGDLSDLPARTFHTCLTRNAPVEIRLHPAAARSITFCHPHPFAALAKEILHHPGLAALLLFLPAQAVVRIRVLKALGYAFTTGECEADKGRSLH